VNANLVSRKLSLVKEVETLSYLTEQEVAQISQQAKRGRNGGRNSLLIDLLFQNRAEDLRSFSLNSKTLAKL
jgi:hypothetical protein